MKFKKFLAISLSTALMMSAIPVYADETDLVTFEDSADSEEENDDDFISFEDQEYDEEVAETENFGSGDEEFQIIDNEANSNNDFAFSDGTDEILMAGIAADNKAPVIESITIDKHDVTVGDTVTVTATITDESGIKNFPYIGFYMTESQVHTMDLKPQGDNIYKGSITITEDFVNGAYPAKWCNLEDIYSNGSTDYSFARKYPDLYFCVTGAKEDNEAPIIQSITLDKHDVTVGDTVTVTAEITDESGIKNFPYIGFYMTESQVHTMDLKPQGNNIYKGSITITKDFVNGTYPAKWCNLEDIHSNGSTDYSFAQKYPDLYFSVTGAQEDNKAPIIQSITIDKHDVTAGDTVTVTATITDESGIKNFPYIGFYKTGSQVHTMDLKPQGNNIYKGSITITEDFVNGIYPAKWCNLEDIHSNGSTDYSFAQKYPDLYFRVLCDNHTWGSATITQNATCTDNGEKLYTCTICGATKTEVIPAKGHTKVIDPAVSPTCESTGKTEGSHCSACGEVIVTQNTIPATGHSWDNGKVTQEPTCDNTGIKTYTCATCGKTKTENINSLGHKEVIDPAVSATCETNGKTEGSHCSVCGRVFIPQNVIPATGHSWDDGTITQNASCENTGIKTYTCTTCSKTKTEDIAATGHSWDNGKITKEASCTEPGVKTFTCTTCKKTKTEDIAATGHFWDNGKITKEASCIEPGIKTYTCTNCQETKVENINAAGHKFSSWKTSSPATVFAPEKQVRTCSTCGKEEQKEVGSKLQKTMKISATSVTLKIKQETTALKVTGLAEGDSIISWKSNNTKIATISGKADGTCIIKAGKKTGKAKITITLKSGLQKTVNVSVQKGTVKTKKITGIAKSLKLKKKQKTVLHPVIAPLTSTEKITYKSSNSKIATVNSKGQITAKKKGTAIITVKSGNKSVKCKITVK